MPFFWQIDATQWLNPTHIFHIEDLPRSHPPRLRVWMAASETSELGTAVQSTVLVLERIFRLEMRELIDSKRQHRKA